MLSLGKPVVASKTGGNITVADITDGVKLYEKDNECEFINIINKLINNRDLLETMGRKKFTRYNEYFTVDKFADRYIKVVENIINDLN